MVGLNKYDDDDDDDVNRLMAYASFFQQRPMTIKVDTTPTSVS